MALATDATIAEIRAAIRANIMYAYNDSLTQARDFVEAVSVALVVVPSRAAKGQEEFEFDLRNLETMRREAHTFIAKKQGASEKYWATRKAGGYP